MPKRPKQDSQNIEVAFIGGSGLYEINDLLDPEELDVETPYGHPSSSLSVGTLENRRVAFLARHGRFHQYLPTEIPNRANIYALKKLGVERIVSISAVGSLDESILPLSIVVPDQLIDRTKNRDNTFFGDGIVAHISFADPYCPSLSRSLIEACEMENASFKDKGTYVVIEGPQFSTRAESNLYRQMGANIIGMTAIPESKLAREAEICYSTLALVIDYDSWLSYGEVVSASMVHNNLRENIANSIKVIKSLIRRLPADSNCNCREALSHALMTDNIQTYRQLKDPIKLMLNKYLNQGSR